MAWKFGLKWHPAVKFEYVNKNQPELYIWFNYYWVIHGFRCILNRNFFLIHVKYRCQNSLKNIFLRIRPRQRLSTKISIPCLNNRSAVSLFGVVVSLIMAVDQDVLVPWRPDNEGSTYQWLWGRALKWQISWFLIFLVSEFVKILLVAVFENRLSSLDWFPSRWLWSFQKFKFRKICRSKFLKIQKIIISLYGRLVTL